MSRAIPSHTAATKSDGWYFTILYMLSMNNHVFQSYAYAFSVYNYGAAVLHWIWLFVRCCFWGSVFQYKHTSLGKNYRSEPDEPNSAGVWYCPAVLQLLHLPQILVSLCEITCPLVWIHEDRRSLTVCTGCRSGAFQWQQNKEEWLAEPLRQ